MPDAPQPHLTFFTELPGPACLELVQSPGVVDALAGRGAAVSMAMLDLDARRARAIEHLNAGGVAVTAWLLVDEERGYWLNADNARHARHQFHRVLNWAEARGLAFEAVGLDIEAPHQDALDLVRRGRQALAHLLRRRRSRQALRGAAAIYADLVAHIRGQGLRVETYQFPLIADDRRAASTLVQRTLGIVDVPADREVLMLYRSMLPPPVGEALIDAYGAEAGGIGVGITGGGVDFLLPEVAARLLDRDRLVEDLRRAVRYTPHLYVFSLEGCVEEGFLADVCRTDLSAPLPRHPAALAAPIARGLLRTALRSEGAWDRWIPRQPPTSR